MEIIRTHFKAMGCANEITVAAAGRAAVEPAIEAAVQEVLRIEAKYSRYRPDSLLSRINAAAGSTTPFPCDDETLWLLDFAHTLHQQSGGLFDITSGILRRAWNFARPELPSAATLAPLLALIGWDKVVREGRSLRLPLAGMEIDFGGFGKEYAADRAALSLRQHGIEHGYVNLGGDISTLGPQPDGAPWLIGINNPRAAGELIATIPIYQGALATSGDYEKFFDLDGRRYCHVLDPRSGQSVSHWRSVSVLAPLCIAAGSYSTIAMLQEEDGLKFLQETRSTYLAIDRHGEIFCTQAPASTQEKIA